MEHARFMVVDPNDGMVVMLAHGISHLASQVFDARSATYHITLRVLYRYFTNLAPHGNRVAANQPKAAPTSKPVGAASWQAVKSFLLLALVVSLRRMLVSRFRFVDCLRRLLLCAHMIVAAVLLRSGPMGFRSLLMMFGSLLVHILRHRVSLLFE
jgi:hypothetical protein